jgi:hypothetical protein
MFVKLGSRPVVVLSTPEAIQSVLIDHGPHSSGHPPVLGMTVLANDNTRSIASSNGETWRRNQKLALQLLLNKVNIAGYQDIAVHEFEQIVNEIHQTASSSEDNGMVSDWGDMSKKVTASVMLRLCLAWGLRRLVISISRSSVLLLPIILPLSTKSILEISFQCSTLFQARFAQNGLNANVIKV